MNHTLGIVGGAGWLGSAIARAALDCGMIAPEALILSYRSRPARGFGSIRQTQDNAALAAIADVVLLSVRPQDWFELDLAAPGKLVISVMAGIPIADLAQRHGTARVIRALPNAAAEVGASYTPIVASAGATAADLAFAQRLFGACGVAEVFTSEAHLDYLSGLTGTGPAYPALMAVAMIEDAVARGIPADVARRAVGMLFVGAGRLIESGQDDPAVTVETFMDYRGVTAAGLEAMRSAGLRDAVRRGLSAAFDKGLQMRADPPS